MSLFNPPFQVDARAGMVESRARATAMIFSPTITTIQTGGYYAAGDGGNAIYKRVGAQPAHAGKFQSLDGSWFEIAAGEVNPKQFGAKWDGVTVDTVAIQACIDYAATTFNSITLPGGTAMTGTLDLKLKYIKMVGAGLDVTILKAVVGTGIVIDAFQNTDGQDLMFNLSDFTIDGNNSATTGIKIRYRHSAVLSSVKVVSLPGDAYFAQDAWLVTWFNVVSLSNTNGFVLNGANHRNALYSCSARGSTGTHVRVNKNSTANDGNDAIVFENLDIEYGAGIGLWVETTCTINLVSCYLGEGIASDSVRNYGNINVSGGLFAFGYLGNAGIRPLSGNVIFSGACKIVDQGNGISSFIQLTDAEVDGGADGKVAVNDSYFFTPIGGQPVFNGDPIGFSGRSSPFAKSSPKSYTTTYAFGAVASAVVNGDGSMTCTATSKSGGGPFIIGVNAPLISTDWVVGKPLYIVVVYKSVGTGAISFRLTSAAGGGTYTQNLTSSANVGRARTLFKADAIATADPFTLFEVIKEVVNVGDNFTLYGIYLYDSTYIKNSNGSSIGFLTK